MRNVSQLKDFVYDEAEEYPSFELDAVREVADNDEGTTLRILVEDGEAESDQVGFQVTRPNIQQGRQMFNRRVLNGLKEIRDRYRDDRDGSNTRDFDASADPDEDIDTTDTEPASDVAETPPSEPTTTTGGADLGSLGVTVSLDEESEAELVEEFESVLEDIEELTASEDDVDAIEERLDSIDDRLTQLEETLSMVGQ